MTDTEDEETQLERAAEELGVSKEFLRDEAERAKDWIGAAKTAASTDTAGTMPCHICGGQARWTREGRDYEVKCVCGFEAYGTAPERAN